MKARAVVEGRRGFTLLEVVIALAILSLTLVVLLGLKNQDIRLATQAKEMTTATALARMKVVETEMAGFPELGEIEGDFSEDYPGYRWRQVISPTPFDYVREAQIVVSWGGNEQNRVEMFKYLFEKQ